MPESESTINYLEYVTLEDFQELLQDIYNFQYGVFRDEGNGIWVLATGGWSENEEALMELEQTMFWIVAWTKSERGGAYTFDANKIPKGAQE